LNKNRIRKFIEENKMNSMKTAFAFLILLIIGIAGCETLQEPKAIFPILEYEKVLMGRLDANYIGTDNCLAACHYHDKIRNDFDASTMGAQMSAESGMPLVNCESCHGPGSLAVEGMTAESVTKDDDGYYNSCNYDSLIDLQKIAPQAQSLLCLKCHTQNATFNLHNWMAGAHSINDVSCFDCHNLHAGPTLVTEAQDTKDMCLECHKQQEAEFSLLSAHPVLQKKMFCTDCHNPHGTVNEGLLREDSVKETCTSCHGEKEGPFVFEHADLNDDCSICHSSHGSINNNLLNVSEPFLCLQCHGGHRTSSGSITLDSKGAFYTRCTDCHSQIHGTDLPSTSGEGMFIN
jgi:DmsE family decaheme c-type cytochrome